ncbi:cell cycle checkpoint protein RAD17 isoform X2 [Venturia canescens]|nr:cell cycle checkpoint protein RAD17 isoform X2 [Venturia canescens]
MLLAFEEAEKELPARKRQKRNDPHNEDLFIMPTTVKYKKTNEIHSLSKLMEACEPKKTADLAVSKQKQKEINEWFLDGISLKGPRILVISGPSGCGKTAALKIIAKENHFTVVEWTNPTDSNDYGSYAKQSDKFLDFLIRTTRYNSLFELNSRRLLLVKDIPNVYFVETDQFTTLLENYFEYGKEPLVFICNDGGTSKMMKTLFPSKVRDQFNIDHIGVNSTTQAAMKNMLKRVAPILNARADEFINVRQHHIDEVLSNSVGDVRSSILNLIFNSLKVSDKLKHECETRAESLSLLHAIGRVINPKRVESGDSWKFVHDPDEISSSFLSQSIIFLHFLHENYMNTISDVEEIELCSDILSISDMITHGWQDINLIKLNLSLCIRGVMVHNKNPVSGWNPVRKPRSEEIQMSRNLGFAEEAWYKKIICPKETRDSLNLENTVIEQNSD